MTSVTFTERFQNKACPQFSVIDFNQVSVSCGLIPFRHEQCIKGEGCLLRAYDPFGAGIYFILFILFFFPEIHVVEVLRIYFYQKNIELLKTRCGSSPQHLGVGVMS